VAYYFEVRDCCSYCVVHFILCFVCFVLFVVCF